MIFESGLRHWWECGGRFDRLGFLGAKSGKMLDFHRGTMEHIDFDGLGDSHSSCMMFREFLFRTLVCLARLYGHGLNGVGF